LSFETAFENVTTSVIGCTRHVRVVDFVSFNFPVLERYASFGHLDVEIAWTLKLAKLKVEGTPTVGGVDLKKRRFVPGGFSCTNSPLYLAKSCGWVQ